MRCLLKKNKKINMRHMTRALQWLEEIVHDIEGMPSDSNKAQHSRTGISLAEMKEGEMRKPIFPQQHEKLKFVLKLVDAQGKKMPLSAEKNAQRSISRSITWL